MEIYILRHGDAELRRTGLAEADRKLTPKGKQEVGRVVKMAWGPEPEPQLILTSPYRRAKETAAIAAKTLKKAKMLETKSLLPQARPEQVWKEISTHKDITDVVLVGHEPHMGRLVAYLLEAALLIDLKKGAIARISTDSTNGPPRGTLKWVITPRLAKGK